MRLRRWLGVLGVAGAVLLVLQMVAVQRVVEVAEVEKGEWEGPREVPVGKTAEPVDVSKPFTPHQCAEPWPARKNSSIGRGVCEAPPLPLLEPPTMDLRDVGPCPLPEAGMFANVECVGDECRLKVECPPPQRAWFRMGDPACLSKQYCWKPVPGYGYMMRYEGGACLMAQREYHAASPPKMVADWAWVACGNSINYVHHPLRSQGAVERYRERLKDVDAARPHAVPDVHVLVVDSTSTGSFHRYYCETQQVLKEIDESEDFAAFQFDLYRGTGPRTVKNIAQLLGGYPTDTRSPRFGHSNETMATCERCVWLPEAFREFGYAVSYASDVDTSLSGVVHASFCDRVTEINDHTLELGLHYATAQSWKQPMNEFGEHIKFFENQPRRQCVHGMYACEHMFDWEERLQRTYKDMPVFSWNKLVDNHKTDLASHSFFDGKLAGYLRRRVEIARHKGRPLVMFVVGDHGQPLGPHSKTPLGEREKGMPMMLAVVSRAFGGLGVMAANENKLVSHHDLHVTVKWVLKSIDARRYEEVVGDSENPHGESLFEVELGAERTCEQAGVPPAMCGCYEMQEVEDVDREELVRAAVKESELMMEEDPQAREHCATWGSGNVRAHIVGEVRCANGDAHGLCFAQLDVCLGQRCVPFSLGVDGVGRKVVALARQTSYETEACVRQVGKVVREVCLCAG